MFNGRCFKDNCKNKIYAKCDCEAKVFFCEEHEFEHWSIPSANGHQLIRLFIKPPEEIKQIIIQKLSDLKKEIKVYKNKAIINANKLIKSFNATFEKHLYQVKEVGERCSKMIKELINEEELLDIGSEDDMESVLKFDIQQAKHKMAWWSTNCCNLDYKGINEAISKTYEIPFNPFNTFGGAVEDEVESNELSFFRHDTCNFSTINLDNFQVSSTITLSTQEPIHYLASTCILPDNSYFYCCNPNSNSGLTFIIDKNKAVKQLENSKINYYLDPVYYKNFIYLIGGYNKLAERYDFIENLWQALAPLPQGFNFNQSCNSLFDDSILITGYYLRKVICYRIIQNNYKDIPHLELEERRYKFMLRGNSRIYLFERGARIFESAENDVSNWANIGRNAIVANCLRQSSVVSYKGSIYFVEYDSQLWKFDLSSKQLSQVRMSK